MMELTKRELILSISFIAMIILYGCQNNTIKETNEIFLECLLDTYFVENKIDQGNSIFISNTSDWSDSTSVIRILLISNNNQGMRKDVLFTKYKGVNVYLENISLLGKLNSKIIANNLQWSKLTTSNFDKEDEMVPPEEFSETQIVYSSLNNCIEKIIMGSNSLKNLMEKNCSYCR